MQLTPIPQQMANNCSGRAVMHGWSNAGVTVPTSCWLAGSLLMRIPCAPGARPGDSTTQTHCNATLRCRAAAHQEDDQRPRMSTRGNRREKADRMQQNNGRAIVCVMGQCLGRLVESPVESLVAHTCNPNTPC